MTKLLAGWILLCVGCLAGPPPARAVDCIAAPAAGVIRARQVLLALPLTGGPNVPPAARQGVTAMKAALADFILAQLSCSALDISAESLQNTLSESAQASADTDPEDEGIPRDAYNYGYRLSFEVKRWPANPKLLSVVAKFQIECGADALLMIFDSSQGSWSEMLRWQSEPYEKVSGAFGSFDYRVSPPDHSGKWYVLVKRIPPWCSSTWSSMSYAVLRPQSGGVTPRKIFAADPFMWWGGDDYGELTANASGFGVSFHGRDHDTALLVRSWIETYSIAGDTVGRVQPIAATPLDFVDEWIQEDWPNAQRWSDPKAAATLKGLHDQLQALETLEYRSLRRCSEGSTRFEISADDTNSDVKYRFAVSGDAQLTLKSATASPGVVCKGEDVSFH